MVPVFLSLTQSVCAWQTCDAVIWINIHPYSCLCRINCSLRRNVLIDSKWPRRAVAAGRRRWGVSEAGGVVWVPFRLTFVSTGVEGYWNFSTLPPDSLPPPRPPPRLWLHPHLSPNIKSSVSYDRSKSRFLLLLLLRVLTMSFSPRGSRRRTTLLLRWNCEFSWLSECWIFRRQKRIRRCLCRIMDDKYAWSAVFNKIYLRALLGLISSSSSSTPEMRWDEMPSMLIEIGL